MDGQDSHSKLRYTEAQMQAAIVLAAKEAANSMLEKFAGAIGVDLTNKDQLELLRQDRAFVRSLRVGRDAMGAKIGLAILLIFVGGVMTMIYNGVITLIQTIRVH